MQFSLRQNVLQNIGETEDFLVQEAVLGVGLVGEEVGLVGLVVLGVREGKVD